MQKVTIKYGIESLDKSFTIPVTIRQLRTDANIKAVLGYGDNVRLLINGVEMPDDAVVPNGATVIVETRANQKALVLA